MRRRGDERGSSCARRGGGPKGASSTLTLTLTPEGGTPVFRNDSSNALTDQSRYSETNNKKFGETRKTKIERGEDRDTKIERGQKKYFLKPKIEPLCRWRGRGTEGTEELAEHNLSPTQWLRTTLPHLLSEKFLPRDTCLTFPIPLPFTYTLTYYIPNT